MLPGKVICLTARQSVVFACLRADSMLSDLPTETPSAPARQLLNAVEDRRIADPIARPRVLAATGAEPALYRRLAQRAFTPRAVEEHIENAACGLREAMSRRHDDGSPDDVIGEFAEILPVVTIASIDPSRTVPRASVGRGEPQSDVFDDRAFRRHRFQCQGAPDVRRRPAFRVGAALARMESETAMRALFERFPVLAPAGPPLRRLRGW